MTNLIVSAVSALTLAIGQVEDGKPNGVYDGGKSVGTYCIQSSVCRDLGVNPRLRSSPVMAQAIAEAHVNKLRRDLTRAIGHEPSDAGIYCAWKLGMTGFSRYGYRISRCPAWVRQRARDVANIAQNIRQHQP